MDHVNVFNDLPSIEFDQESKLPYVWQTESNYDCHQYEGFHAHHSSSPGMKTPYSHVQGFSVKTLEHGFYVEKPTSYLPGYYEDNFHEYGPYSLPNGLPTPPDGSPILCDDLESQSTTSRSQPWSSTQPEELSRSESGYHPSEMPQWSMAPCNAISQSSPLPTSPQSDNFVAMNQLCPESDLSHCDGGLATPALHSAPDHPFAWSEPPDAHASPAPLESDDDMSSPDSFEDSPSDGEDATYNPSRPTRPQHKRRMSASSRRSTRTKRQTGSRRASSGASASSSRTAAGRAFPCPLAQYGCEATFASKNEWKRHVATQHVKVGFWRCELCPATASGPNDFNRKDLFTQHLKRMHRQHIVDTYDRAKRQAYADLAKIPDNELKDATEPLVQSCLRELRQPPQRCRCLFCDRVFKGATAWDNRMDHLAAHLERFRKSHGQAPPVHEWKTDDELEFWLEQEGLIERVTKGKWQKGDGVPIRNG